MNIAGLGIDAVKIERFRRIVEQRGDGFLRKIFTERELEHAGGRKGFSAHMAGKFAAKEAVKKALPDGAEIGLNWTEIEILNDGAGKPYACLHGHARCLMEKFDLAQVYVSISHTKDLAISNAVGVKNGT